MNKRVQLILVLIATIFFSCTTEYSDSIVKSMFSSKCKDVTVEDLNDLKQVASNIDYCFQRTTDEPWKLDTVYAIGKDTLVYESIAIQAEVKDSSLEFYNDMKMYYADNIRIGGSFEPFRKKKIIFLYRTLNKSRELIFETAIGPEDYKR